MSTADATGSRPAQAEALRWPLLVSASRARPVVIVGGAPRRALIERLRDEGIYVAWDPVTKNGSEQVAHAIVQRVERGSVSAMLFVHGFLFHRHLKEFYAAAQRARVPNGYARLGGKESMRKALNKIEAELCARRAS